MIAAAAEATWLECGAAVATKLGDAVLQATINDPYVGIGRKVADIHKALGSPKGKPILQTAGQTMAKVTDAQVWTTVLRDRRNAIHWDRAQGFVAHHSDTASLLLALPIHLETLESIRLA